MARVFCVVIVSAQQADSLETCACLFRPLAFPIIKAACLCARLFFLRIKRLHTGQQRNQACYDHVTTFPMRAEKMLENLCICIGISEVSDDVQRGNLYFNWKLFNIKKIVLIILHTLIQETQILFGMDDKS